MSEKITLKDMYLLEKEIKEIENQINSLEKLKDIKKAMLNKVEEILYPY